MKRYGLILLALLALAAGNVTGGSLFTDVASHATPKMVTQINTALDALEDSIDGTTAMASPVVQGTLTAISTNSATTNVIITVDGVVDGETIGDDTIDDDSIDFGDVTGADLTLTDCGSVVGTALSSGTGETTVDGKYAVTGGDATTGLMLQKAAITSTAVGPQTNSFAVVFGAAPIVTCTYTEDPGDVQPLYVTSVTPSNFVCTVTADKNFGYIAVGTRP